jgi:hypothetical protein
MSRLKVVDLSFFETELANISQVQGGTSYGSYSTSYSSDRSSGYIADYSVNKNNRTISYVVSAHAGGAVAGAIAAAVSDLGITYTSASTTTIA